MVTRLKDFWRQLWEKIHNSTWITLQGFLMVVVGLAFLALIIWSEPITRMLFPVASVTATPIANTPVVQPTSSIPLLYHQNMKDTVINMLGAGLVLIIILVGTLTHIHYRRKLPETKKK